MTNFDLHSTFFPGQQIEDPKWFAGRKFDLERALKALCRDGSSIIVYGERGVGKSSFVEMIKLIASGDCHLLYKYDYHKIYPPEKLKYKIAYVECDEDTNTTAKVLQRLLTSPLGIKKIINSKLEKLESTIKDKITLDFLKVFSYTTEEESKETRIELKEESIFEIFSNIVLTISHEILNNGEGLLLVIDEFDRIQDSSKISSLIKTLSKNKTKFLISGIAESYEELLSGHQSVIRQLFEGRINIQVMNEDEIKDLFKLVESNSKNALLFNEGFIKEVINKSQGFPYYVQLFGQLAIDTYAEKHGIVGPAHINAENLRLGLQKLLLYEPQMEREYNNIIKENAGKELLLKALARQIPKKINEIEVFSYCRKRGLMQGKQIMTSLLAHREPHFLNRIKDSEYVSFINPLFKTYAASREPILIKLGADNDLKLK